MKIPRILLAAGASGSGKTLITCGLLQALVGRGLKTASFKCGPDYIDPMFHSRVIGTRSRNLDTFFTSENITRGIFQKNAVGCDISVMEMCIRDRGQTANASELIKKIAKGEKE